MGSQAKQTGHCIVPGAPGDGESCSSTLLLSTASFACVEVTLALRGTASASSGLVWQFWCAINVGKECVLNRQCEQWNTLEPAASPSFATSGLLLNPASTSFGWVLARWTCSPDLSRYVAGQNGQSTGLTAACCFRAARDLLPGLACQILNCVSNLDISYTEAFQKERWTDPKYRPIYSHEQI